MYITLGKLRVDRKAAYASEELSYNKSRINAEGA